MNELSESRVLFFVPGSSVLTYGTFASQVVGQALALSKLGATCAIVHRNPAAKAKVEKLPNGLTLINVTDEDPMLPVYRLKRRYNIIINKLEKEILGFAPTHIYTREYGCELGVRAFCERYGIQLIYSMRGPDAYERYKLGGLKNILASLIMLLDVKRAVRSCDKFTTLSRNFVDWCEKKFRRTGVLIPCCVSDRFFNKITAQERAAIRQSFGFGESDKIVVWCGNVAYWQLLDQVIVFVSELMNLDESVRVLFIANKPENIESICLEHSMDRGKYRTVRGRPEDIPALLQACDIGIDILEVDDFKSSICSPIKVGEYLASGLPVVISRTMGDFPDIVKENNVGVVIDNDISVPEVMRHIDECLSKPRDNQIRVALRHFSWDCFTNELINLFK